MGFRWLKGKACWVETECKSFNRNSLQCLGGGECFDDHAVICFPGNCG